MPYNLPPFWSRGFAIPDYVRVEDLQRRTFVTQQMPRGTYDNPDVGAAGYAVPDYVMKEGYGQGAVITKWMPRGTAPRVPYYQQQPRARVVAQVPAPNNGSQYAIVASSSGPAPADPYADYGRQVADRVLSSVRAMPAAKRRDALKQIFDKVDAKLWTRIQATASQLAKAGIPPQKSLHQAIQTEFRAGIVSDLVRRGKAAQPSPPAVGCYTCAAAVLGDDAAAGHWERPTAADIAAAGPNLCPNVFGPGAPGIWVGGSAPPASCPGGGESRTHAGQSPADVQKAIDQAKAQASVTPCGMKDATGALITNCNPNIPLTTFQVVTVGPFSFRIASGKGTTTDVTNKFGDPSQIPADKMAWLKSQVDKHIKSPFNTHNGKATQYLDNAAHYWFGYGENYYLDNSYFSHNPAKFPVSAISDDVQVGPNVYAVYLFMSGKEDGGGPPYMHVVLAPKSSSAHDNPDNSILGQISRGASTVVDAVGSVAKAIGDMACNAVNQPGAAPVAAAASTNPYAAAGAVAAGALCAKPAAPPAVAATQVAPMAPPSSMMPVLLIGGAAVLGIYLLTGKKKR